MGSYIQPPESMSCARSPVRTVTELSTTLVNASVTHLPRLLPSFPSASPAEWYAGGIFCWPAL